MIKYCCDWFNRLIEQAGEKGSSIVAYRDGEHRSFYLQTRPFEKDVIEKYNSIDEKTGNNKWPDLYDKREIPVPWVFALNIPIKFCPQCGTNLEKIIKKNKKEFDRIATEMENYQK